jgi:hypothetical protein
MKKVLFALLLLCSSCSSNILILKPNTQLQRLGICFKEGPYRNELVATSFENALDDFIARYNASAKRKFELYRAQSDGPATLTIELFETQLVTPGQQSAGVLVSLVGLSLPIIMASAGAEFVLFFWYFPNAKSMMELSLSPDIADPVHGRRPFQLSSPGFLKSPEHQIAKHAEYFSKTLAKIISQFEKQLKPITQQ